jgi:hypothetical protein
LYTPRHLCVVPLGLAHYLSKLGVEIGVGFSQYLHIGRQFVIDLSTYSGDCLIPEIVIIVAGG